MIVGVLGNDMATSMELGWLEVGDFGMTQVMLLKKLKAVKVTALQEMDMTILRTPSPTM